MHQNKVIIDSDPGVDDALALAFAVKADLPLDAICSVYGNSTVENCTTNVLTILHLAGANVPVYQGEAQPIQGSNKFAESHGESGLGGFILPTEQKVESLSAVEYYKKIVKEADDEITVVAIGPTTNLGVFFQQEPALAAKIHKIVIMGAVFGEKGNVTPYAEFNVYNDPYSLDIILKSSHPNITIVPANICRRVTFTQELFDRISNPDLAAGLAKISQVYIDYYSHDAQYGGFAGGVMYDLLAVTLLVDPSLFEAEKKYVTVETKDNEHFGQTLISDGQPNCEVVTAVDEASLKELYISIMNR